MAGLFDRSTLDSVLSAEEKSALLSFSFRPAVRPSQVQVDCSDFLASHGRAPRGFGRWIFCTVNPRWRADYLDHLISLSSSSFGEAKQAARIQAAARGIKLIFVCA